MCALIKKALSEAPGLDMKKTTCCAGINIHLINNGN